MGWKELCGGVHTAQRQIPTQITIGFCANLSVSVFVLVSVSVSVSGSVTAPLCCSFSYSTGYTATALGVRSHCKLRDIPHLPDNKFEIAIVDRLPQISLATSLAKAASFTSVGDSACVVNSATTCLYAGQR